MKFGEIYENFKIALDSMRSNKLRSFLASLGVVIGISFVIIMGWVLEGLDTVAEDTFNTIGEDMLFVSKWDWAGRTSWKLSRYRKDLTYEQFEEFAARIENAEVVVPNYNAWGRSIRYDGNSYNGLSIVGVTAENAKTPAGQIMEGRFFNAYEDMVGEKVVVIGYKVYETIFPNGNAIGRKVQIGGREYEVIGVIPSRGGAFLDFLDNQCYIPVKAFKQTFGTRRVSLNIGVKAGGIENLDETRAETVGLMRVIRNVKPGEDNDFSINESKVFEAQTRNIRFMVWGIGIGMTVLSFIVGIIGIMNIMFVSVAERTKEIGIRKAIGAKKSSILTQFIFESSGLCLIGAIMSLILCSGIIYAAATIVPKFWEEASFLSPYMPVNLLITASIVSIIVGVLAGISPAMRAANLDPVEAMRAD